MATAVTQNVTQASKVRDLGDDVSEFKALFGSENHGAQVGFEPPTRGFSVRP